MLRRWTTLCAARWVFGVVAREFFWIFRGFTGCAVGRARWSPAWLLVSRPHPPREQFSAAADAQFAVDHLDVGVNGVAAEAQVNGGLFFGITGEQAVEHTSGARRQGLDAGVLL